MKTEIEISRAADLTRAERETIDAWLWQVFGEEAGEYQWSDVDWHVFLRAEGEIVSHAEIVERAALAGGKPVRLGGSAVWSPGLRGEEGGCPARC